MIGTCIGAGLLGIPYVAAKAGFFVALIYIILIGLMMLITNLYLGEVSLRTDGNHQLQGYARKYLGKKRSYLMGFATIFGIYSAIVAYLLGIGESLSFLIFGNLGHHILFGVLFGFLMAGLLWRGMFSLKKFEKWGVAIILFLIFFILLISFKNLNFNNFLTFNSASIFLPFGVVLFAMMSFHAIPEIEIVLRQNKKLMKKVLIFGTLIPILFYILFVFVVVGLKGSETPQLATLALGKIFVLLGIFTMFTSYLSLGNALQENFRFDDKMKKFKAWFFASLIPIGIYLITRFFDIFSFTKILSIGGVVSGGITGILILMMVKQAKKKGTRKPEYSLPINWFIIGLFSLIFLLGVVYELFF